MVLLLPHTFAFSCHLSTWPSSLSACMTRKTHRIVKKLLGYIISSYRFCGQVMLLWLGYCIYCVSAPSLHRVYQLSDMHAVILHCFFCYMLAYPTTANSIPSLVQDEEANLSWKVKKYPIHVFGMNSM